MNANQEQPQAWMRELAQDICDIEDIVMKYDPPNLFRAVCQYCGAEGPLATTHGAAQIMWDERRSPGDSKAFCTLAERLAGYEREHGEG